MGENKGLMAWVERSKTKRYNKMGVANLVTIFGLTLMGNEGDSQFDLAALSAQDAQRLTDIQ
ncbi:hypothetical protein AB4K20DRAFT_1889234 [Rhizopus microsporus]